jgi:Tfp pilus assembly protein PilX
MARPEDSAPRAPRRRRGEQGSAYIIALLALVALTMLGLAAALVTQSEMQVGANERVINRVFYAADSGIATATARALVESSYTAHDFATQDKPGTITLQNQVRVSVFFPIRDSPCNLCEINNAGTYSEKAYRKINHAVTSTASRMGLDSSTTLAQKVVAAMVEVQPWKANVEAYAPINDPDQLKELRF